MKNVTSYLPRGSSGLELPGDLPLPVPESRLRHWASRFWWGPGKPSLLQVRLLMLSTPSADKKMGTQSLKSPFVLNLPDHKGRTGQLEMAPT